MLRGHAEERVFGLLIVLAWSAPCVPASAQTLKEELQQHVRENVEKEQEEERKRREAEERKQKQPKPQPKPAEVHEQPAPAAAPASSTPPEGGVHFSFDSNAPAEPEKKPEGPELPVRVFGKNFKLDITVGGGYRGWLPQHYQAVAVDVGNYATWNIDIKAKFFSWLTLRRGYYESNGVAAPRTSEAAVATKIGSYAPKAMRVLGVLGVPIGKAWEPQIRYESHGFETRALPEKNVCVVSRSATGDEMGCANGSRGELKMVSGFETLVAGVHYDHSKSGSPVVGPAIHDKIPPLFFGIGLMQYRKPYQVNVNGVTLDDYLFDSRFRGIGLALGTELGGGIDRFFGEIDMQLGAGEVSLSDKLTLNQVIPNGYTIGYVQGTATLGYRWAMIHAAPTLILVPVITLGGADFFLVSTNNDNKDAPSPSVNWDLLWTAQVSLLIPL